MGFWAGPGKTTGRTWICVSCMQDFTPTWFQHAAVGNCSETLKIQVKTPLFHHDSKSKKAPNKNKCFLLADLPLAEIRNGVNGTLLGGGDGRATRGVQQSRWVEQTGKTLQKCEAVASSFLMYWPAVRKQRLLQHWSAVSQKPQKVLFLPLQASQMKPPQRAAEQWPLTAERWQGNEQQGLRNNLRSCAENHAGNTLKCFPKDIVYSWQIIWKEKCFYFSVNWVLPLGRKSLERMNVQMATRFVIPLVWPFKPHIFLKCVFCFQAFKGLIWFIFFEVMQTHHCLPKF